MYIYIYITYTYILHIYIPAKSNPHKMKGKRPYLVFFKENFLWPFNSQKQSIANTIKKTEMPITK